MKKLIFVGTSNEFRFLKKIMIETVCAMKIDLQQTKNLQLLSLFL